MNWKITSNENYPPGNNPLGNPFYGYQKTYVELPNGSQAKYYGIDVGSCVHIVAVEQDTTTYFVRQHRPNARMRGSNDIPVTLELPGGFASAEMGLVDSAHTELRQEIGKIATQIQQIGVLLSLPGASNEHDTIFLGQGLVDADTHDKSHEPTELDMRIEAMPFGRAYDIMRKGERPVSAQTLAGMTLAAQYIL